MSKDVPKGRRVRMDPEAVSTSPTAPAFAAKPVDAPVYYGFPVLESSLTDGWKLGIITDPTDPAAAGSLDAFVVAPDGSRAGLVWDINVGGISEILGPSPGRWGVYSVPLARPVHGDEELVAEFRRLLPELKKLWIQAHDA